MKKKKIGKSLTRKTVLIPEANDSLEDCIKQGFDLISEGQPSGSFHEWLLEYKTLQENHLKDKGLPFKSKLWQVRDDEDGFKWVMKRPKSLSYCGVASLEYYLINELGLPHDSDECLTAQILERVDSLIELNIPKDDEKGYRDAYFLAELITKRIIYARNAHNHKKNAAGEKSPLTPYVKSLAKQSGTAKEKWIALFDRMFNDGLVVDDTLRPELDNIDDESFIEYYIEDMKDSREKEKMKRIKFRNFSNQLSRNKK